MFSNDSDLFLHQFLPSFPSPRIGAARPEMLIQIFVHFDKENPEGIWTLVDYERTPACRVMGDGLEMGAKCCREHLTHFLKIMQDPASHFGKHFTNRGVAPCLTLSDPSLPMESARHPNTVLSPARTKHAIKTPKLNPGWHLPETQKCGQIA